MCSLSGKHLVVEEHRIEVYYPLLRETLFSELDKRSLEFKKVKAGDEVLVVAHAEV